jgi:hypothetical protein
MSNGKYVLFMQNHRGLMFAGIEGPADEPDVVTVLERSAAEEFDTAADAYRFGALHNLGDMRVGIR